MNLLFLNSIEKATYGGMEEWIRLVAGGLSERGHDVTVAGRPGSQFLERIKAAAAQVKILPVDISSDFSPATIARLSRYLKKHGIDTIVANFNKDVRLGGIAARLEGDVRVIWSVGLDITKDSFVHRFLTPRLVDGVIVPSESLKRQITRLGYILPATVEVIPIGIPEKQIVRTPEIREELRRRYKLPRDSFVAVTVGRLVEQKGHRYLLEAVAALVNIHPSMRFVFCGDGPLKAELQAKAAECGITEFIVFAGMLDSVDDVLAGADLMIHPSIEEPFGIAVLEGMRAGLPIVASRVGGIPEVLGDAGAMVEPRSPEAITHAVSRRVSQPEVLTKASEAARRRFTTQFSEGTMLDRIEHYLDAVVRVEQPHG